MSKEQFERVAIVLIEGGKEYIVLEPQLITDYGEGQGPKGGVIVVEDGWLAVHGEGEARLAAGVQEQGGTFPPRLTLADLNGKLMVEIAAYEGPASSGARVYLEGSSATLRMRDVNANERVLLNGDAGSIWLGGKYANGEIYLFRSTEQDNRNWAKATIRLSANSANISAGGNNTDGTLFLNNQQNEPRIHLSAGGGPPPSPQTTVHIDGVHGNIRLGGHHQDGDLLLINQLDEVRIHLDAGGGPVSPQTTTVYLDGVNGNLSLGGNNTVGDLMLLDQLGKKRIHLRADGGPVHADTRVHIDGAKGDIVLANADCAEEFDIADSAMVEPGTVMVIDSDGRLQKSDGPYDKKVAGVISGDGESGPAIVLGRKESQHQRVAVALAGKVNCKVDARYAPIGAGDLLVTSPSPGHAMKAEDPLRAFGAVVGKALQPLPAGQGLIPVLVALQ